MNPEDVLRAADQELAIRQCVARVQAEAARLMVEHEELSVNACLMMAWQLEVLLYGNPLEPPPVGILGRSPIQRAKGQ